MADPQDDTQGSNLSPATGAVPAERAIGATGETEMLEVVEQEIARWLDEADEERAAIVAQARREALAIQVSAAQEVERLRAQAAALLEQSRERSEEIVQEGERAVAVMRAETFKAVSAKLQEAERESAELRRSASEDAGRQRLQAATVMARRVEEAEQEAFRVRAQAESEARILRARARRELTMVQSQLQALRTDLATVTDAAAELQTQMDTAMSALAALAADPGGTPALEVAPDRPPELEGPNAIEEASAVLVVREESPDEPGEQLRPELPQDLHPDDEPPRPVVRRTRAGHLGDPEPGVTGPDPVNGQRPREGRLRRRLSRRQADS